MDKRRALALVFRRELFRIRLDPSYPSSLAASPAQMMGTKFHKVHNERPIEWPFDCVNYTSLRRGTFTFQLKFSASFEAFIATPRRAVFQRLHRRLHYLLRVICEIFVFRFSYFYRAAPKRKALNDIRNFTFKTAEKAFARSR
jgi:hypothetical protein